MSKNTPKTELLYQKSKPIDQLAIIDAIELMLRNIKMLQKKFSKFQNQ